MIDKVQKIIAEIKDRISNYQEYIDSGYSDEEVIKQEELKDLLTSIDSMQEEPVSEFLNTESMIESYKQRLISQANGVKNSPLVYMCLASYKHGINETLDTLSLSNVQRTVKNWEEPASEDLPHIRHRDTLDEFSYQCAYDLSNDWAKENPEWNDIKTACKIGAQWQKKKVLSIIKQYADKGEKNYQDSIGEMTYNYWDGFRDCANGIKRELED